MTKKVCSISIFVNDEDYLCRILVEIHLNKSHLANHLIYLCCVEKTHAIVSGNKRLERALSSISEEKTATESQKPCQPASPASPALSKKLAARQKSLKGIPLGVLEKVSSLEEPCEFEMKFEFFPDGREGIMKNIFEAYRNIIILL